MVGMSDFRAGRLLRQAALLRDLARRSMAPALLALAALSSPAGASGPLPAGPGAIALQAVADALGIAPAEARVVSTEARDFPDGSLGCPQPGMAYAQVITPGYRVLVEADGRRFDVRVAGNHGRICSLRKPAPEREPAGQTPPPETGDSPRSFSAPAAAPPAAGGPGASVATPSGGACRTACATRAG